MATLTLRQTTPASGTNKGAPLTNAEVDANFTNLSNAVQTSLLASTYTAADVLRKYGFDAQAGSRLD